MTNIVVRIALAFMLISGALMALSAAPASARASNGPLGATVNPSPFSGCNGDYICAANTWDGYVADSSGSGQQALAATDACNAQSVVAYYPGDRYINDSVLLDYYCSAHDAGATITRGIQALANNRSPHPLRLGLGEWGATANGAAPTPTQWNNYTNYLVMFFATRNINGHANAAIIYFNGPSSQPKNNASGPRDYKVPAIRRMASMGL
jgi:hypothetical protein